MAQAKRPLPPAPEVPVTPPPHRSIKHTQAPVAEPISMTDPIKTGFSLETLQVPIESLLPTRAIHKGVLGSLKFKQIKDSLAEVGLIEPLSVIKADKTQGSLPTYALLDGHLRVLALKDLGWSTATCLLASDDESYTYNARINRLSTVQEHYMIKKAIEQGAPAEKISRALGIKVDEVKRRATLLEGLCREAIELLKDQTFASRVAVLLRRMKETRQIKCVELMIAANNFSVSFCEALVLATPNAMLQETKPKAKKGITTEQILRMERELANVQGQYKLIEQSYGEDVLNLTVAKRYVGKLMERDPIKRFIKRSAPEIFEQFEAVLATATEPAVVNLVR